MKRKSEAFSQLIVGLFMVTVLVLLGYFTIVVSGVDLLSGRNRAPVRIAFSKVGGLKERDNVMYRGTKVGVVDRVQVTASNLVVVAMVDPGIVMRRGCRVSVCNLSMLGGYYLNMEEGTGEELDLTATVLAGETPTDWMQDVSAVARNIREMTARKEIDTIITNLEAISVQVRTLSDKANRFADRATEVADKTGTVVARIERGEGTLGKLLSSDDTVYNDLKDTAAEARATFANAREISAKLNREQTFADLEAGVAAFRQAAEGFDVKATVARADNLLDNLNAVAEGLKNGEGTLGKLARDPEMYDQVQALIRDIRQVIDNYRDTTPISTFSSLAVGAF